MENVNFRLPEDEKQALKDEAEARGYQTLSPYLRKIVRERDTNEHVADRLDELEQRVRALERETNADGRGQRHTTEHEPAEPNTDDYGAHGESESEPGISDVVDELELPGRSNQDIRDRREGVRAIIATLEEGPKTRGELRSLFEEHPGGYETEESWWKNCMQPTVQELRDRGHITYHDRGDERYEYELVR